jgi:hypothetical protein
MLHLCSMFHFDIGKETNRTRHHKFDDDMVIIQQVSSTEEDDMVVLSNETSRGPVCQETVGRMMCGDGRIVPILGTGAAPPTPTNYEVLQTADDVCFTLDGVSQDEADEFQKKKDRTRAAFLNSCNPSVSINPPAFAMESKAHGKTQRKTWGVPMF